MRSAECGIGMTDAGAALFRIPHSAFGRIWPMTLLYRFFHYAWIPFVLKGWTRLHVEGREHIPPGGPLVIVSNHVANLDSYVVGVFVRGRVINYLARPDGLRERGLGWYWRKLGAIPADRAGLTEALRILRAGGAVGVFPEGVIARAMVRAIPGSAILARRSGATVIPVAVWGTERVGIGSILRPPRVTVRYGPPRVLSRGKGRNSQAVIDDLMREIAAMLPPSYRGVYGTEGDEVRHGGTEGAHDIDGVGADDGWPSHRPPLRLGGELRLPDDEQWQHEGDG